MRTCMCLNAYVYTCKCSSEGTCPFKCPCLCNVCVIVSMFSPAVEQARGQCLSWCNRQLILSLCKRLTAIQMTCRWDGELRFWQDSVITRDVCGDNVLSAFGWLMLHSVFKKRFSVPLRRAVRLADTRRFQPKPDDLIALWGGGPRGVTKHRCSGLKGYLLGHCRIYILWQGVLISNMSNLAAWPEATLLRSLML